MFGVSQQELLLAGLLVLLVIAAPKVPRIGEWIGSRFDR